MRVPVIEVFGKPDHLHQGKDLLLTFHAVCIKLVKVKPFSDQVGYSLSGIERSIWILKDDLHLLAVGVHIHLVEALAFEENITSGRLQQPKYTPAQRGFPAAGLPYQTEGLSLSD